MNPELNDIFSDCIERIQSGSTLEDCLNLYPEQAALLRPMLETASTVQSANPPVSAVVRDRVWARVDAHIDALPSPAAKPRWQWALPAAAVLLTITVISVLVLVEPARDAVFLAPAVATETPTATASQTATRTPTTTPTVMPTATVTASSTPTATATPSLTSSLLPEPTATPSVTSSPLPEPTITPAGELPVASDEPAESEPCLFSVTAPSINLRAGPGLGYSIVGSSVQGDEYPVLAFHVSNAWINVSSDVVAIWIATSLGEVSGDCANIPVSDVPVLEADDDEDEIEDDDGEDSPPESGAGAGGGEQGPAPVPTDTGNPSPPPTAPPPPCEEMEEGECDDP